MSVGLATGATEATGSRCQLVRTRMLASYSSPPPRRGGGGGEVCPTKNKHGPVKGTVGALPVCPKTARGTAGQGGRGSAYPIPKTAMPPPQKEHVGGAIGSLGGGGVDNNGAPTDSGGTHICAMRAYSLRKDLARRACIMYASAHRRRWDLVGGTTVALLVCPKTAGGAAGRGGRGSAYPIPKTATAIPQ